MQQPFAEKQMKFINESTKKWNIAHGSVRCGKTVGTLFRFMQAAYECPDSQIYMIGHTANTIYDNCIRLLFESEQMSIFRPFCKWFGGTRRELRFFDKTIKTLGAKDEGAVGAIQGKTMSLVYCDEMTLYPDSIIDMIDTRLSNPWSIGIATMNPSHPGHKLKQWIDYAADGDPNYYALHFTLEDNPYLEQSFKERLKKSLTGVFYKRNYLGLWCQAEGAIFECFDRDIHVVKRPPRAAEYWVCGIDYGMTNAFACLLIGVNTGIRTQQGKCLWVEKEFYWDYKQTNRQLTPHEFAERIQEFIEPYSIKAIYIDPSANAMKLELKKLGIHVVDADNDVYNGIMTMTSEMSKGNLFICAECTNTIREIEGYVWDKKAAIEGDDKPVKKGDHSTDALRYVINTHKVSTYDPYKEKSSQVDWQRNKYEPTRRI